MADDATIFFFENQLERRLLQFYKRQGEMDMAEKRCYHSRTTDETQLSGTGTRAAFWHGAIE